MRKAWMYWAYATRSLRRGGQRTIFAVCCIAVGVMAIVALQLVANMVSASLGENIRSLNGGDIQVHIEGTGLAAVQLSYFASLQTRGAISVYSPVSVDDASTNAGGTLAAFSVWAVNPATFPPGGPLRFETPAGATLPGVLAGTTAVATQSLIEEMGLHVGDQFSFTTVSGRAARVTLGGVVADTGFLAQPALLMDEQAYAALPSLAGVPQTFTWVFVNVPGHDSTAAAAVAATIRRDLPLVRTTTVDQALQQNQQQIAEIRYFLQTIGLLALLIGGIGILNTMQVLLRRRQLEIAMLKTAGYRQRDLLPMFGMEAALLGLTGGMLGATVGIATSFVIKRLFERAFFLTLTETVDAGTVIAGVAVGVGVSLIFTLLPIVQAGQVRPLAVLREAQTRPGWHAVLSTGFLLAIVGALFLALAYGILGNALVALVVVSGVSILLGVLLLLFATIAWAIGHVPVPPVMPRAWRSCLRLALRNIGRQRLRTATTLIALSGGVFAIGLGLALGQGLTAAMNDVAISRLQYNAFVLVSSRGNPTVVRQLAEAYGVHGELVTLAIPDRIVAVNGVPLQRLVPGAASGTPALTTVGSSLSGVNGYDLARGAVPAVTMVAGLGDTRVGHNLNASDAGTTQALFPVGDSQAPLRLRLGDALQVASLDGHAAVTLRVAGFYTGGSFANLAPVLADAGVVRNLSAGQPLYVYSLRLDPASAGQTLARIKSAVPSAVAISVAAVVQEIDNLLQSIVLLIEVIAAMGMLAGLLMIGNAVALAMLERRRELGILKSVGHTSPGVLAMVLMENGVIAVTGATLAMLLVVVATTVLVRTTFRFGATFTVAPMLVVGLIAATACICMLVAGGVAWSATRVRPLDVLRYE